MMTAPSGICLHGLSRLQGKNVFCGFSGGADSLALLLILKESAEAFSFFLEAVHFEHGLRGEESLADAEFCRKKCELLHVPFRQISLHVPEQKKTGEGTEEAARRLRMEQWRKLHAETGCVVALGHHAGDAAENLFLRLMRGSNVSGLTSFSVYSETDGFPVIRPLLHASKAEITAFLQKRGETWRTDSTNLESGYGRNFLRNCILPDLYSKFPYSEKGLLRSLENLGEDAQFLEQTANDAWEQMQKQQNFSPQDWKKLPPPVFHRVLRRFIAKRFNSPAFIPGHAWAEQFRQCLENIPGNVMRRLAVPGIPDAMLYISRNTVQTGWTQDFPESVEWNIHESPELVIGKYVFRAEFLNTLPELCTNGKSVLFDLNSFPEKLVIRSRRPGDRMTPFGETHSVSLKKLISGTKTPSAGKQNRPVVCAPDGTLLWVPAIRRSALFPVTPETKQFLQLTVHPPDF